MFVLLFGTNDSQDLESDDGVLQAGSPAWLAVYRARVAKVMDLVHQPATTTVWVGLPVMRSHDYDASMAALDAVYREEAAQRPWISYVDSRSLFASPSGGYTDALPTAAGGEDVGAPGGRDPLVGGRGDADRAGRLVGDRPPVVAARGMTARAAPGASGRQPRRGCGTGAAAARVAGATLSRATIPLTDVAGA